MSGVIFGPSQVVPEEMDCPDVLIMHGCNLLAEAGAQFHVGGFGQDDWNLDVNYDLPIFIEQVPPLMDALAVNEEYELWLYSQGVERVLAFCPDPEKVKIRCRSKTEWRPVPEVEVVERFAFEALLAGLVGNFLSSLQIVDPFLVQLEPFASWRRRW
ncbi:hypothetical protein AB0C21_31415 [Spirillospora sp. NPDC049024]